MALAFIRCLNDLPRREPPLFRNVMISAHEKMKRLKQAQKSVPEVAIVRKPRFDLHKMQKRAVESTAVEIRRILEMPIKQELTQDEYELVSKHYLQAHVFNSPSDPFRRLFDTQAESLVAYGTCGGAFLPLAVGGGKTLVSLLIANDAFQSGKRKVMLCVPPSLVEQLVNTDIPNCRKKTIFNMPVWCLAGLPAERRRSMAASGRQGLYIYTYSLLSSTKDAENNILGTIAPALIILDEAHSVMRRSSRTGRFIRYVNEASPQIVPLSGTMTQKELVEYFELARAALGENNFLPNSRVLTEEISKIIDTTAVSMSEYGNDQQPKAGPIKLWIGWARQNFPHEKDEHDRPLFASSLTGYRQAFQKRLITCPGVVCSSGHELPYSLYLDNTPVKNPQSYPGYDLQQELISKLKNEWITPNGDELEEAMLLYRWLYWIDGAGFYSERYWPTHEWLVEHRKAKDEADAEALLERSNEHLMCQRLYHSNMRRWLNVRSRPKLDSPLLVSKSMSVHGANEVGEELYAAWRDMHNADFEGRIERHKRAVRVCGFKIEQAIRWIHTLPKNEGGLVWYDNDEIGLWMVDRLTEEGIDHLYCPAGKHIDRLLDDREQCKGRVLVLTLNSHYQGKNLQFDHRMFFLQCPRAAKRFEQAIGRQHREKQEYDDVYVTTCNTSEFDKINYGKALNDAAFSHTAGGNQQKIIYGKYLYMPEVVPHEVLMEWGSTPKYELDSVGKAFLEGRFGGAK